MKLARTTDLQDAVVTVMGLGRYKGSGFALVSWLIAQGAQTVITDLKTEEDLRSSMKTIMDASYLTHTKSQKI